MEACIIMYNTVDEVRRDKTFSGRYNEGQKAVGKGNIHEVKGNYEWLEWVSRDKIGEKRRIKMSDFVSLTQISQQQKNITVKGKLFSFK